LLKLFQSIFGSGAVERGKYPDTLVEAAIDRAVEGTDPRIRALSGHRRRIGNAIPKAFDHIVSMVDGLGPPVEASPRTYVGNANLGAFFASAARMTEVFGADPQLREFLKSPAGALANPVLALLAMERTEKKVLGMELSGGQVVSDVAQVVVSFDQHRLVDPSANPEDFRRALLRRAFDQVLSLALGRIAAASGEHESLTAERSALRSKLRALQASGWGFARDGEGEARGDPAAMQARIDEIEKSLEAAGTSTGSLPRHLDLLVETLEKAAEHFRSEPASLLIDRQGVKQTKAGEAVAEVRFTELSNSAGRTLAVATVALPRDSIELRDTIAEATRELR
jgi:hypothetical protein